MYATNELQSYLYSLMLLSLSFLQYYLFRSCFRSILLEIKTLQLWHPDKSYPDVESGR